MASGTGLVLQPAAPVGHRGRNCYAGGGHSHPQAEPTGSLLRTTKGGLMGLVGAPLGRSPGAEAGPGNGAWSPTLTG